MQQMEIEQLSFRLPAFEGPLDLLLHLVRKNKVNIYDIPIAEITDQYLAYIKEMEGMDIGVTADFLVMAATLLSIKSRMLLPREEPLPDEEDPRLELALQLVEYQRYKETLGFFEQRYEVGQRAHTKAPEAIFDQLREKPELHGDLLELYEVFQGLLERVEEKKPPKKETFAPLISRRIYSVADKQRFIYQLLKTKRRIAFLSLFTSKMERGELVAAFLAVLELIREHSLQVRKKGRSGALELLFIEESGAA